MGRFDDDTFELSWGRKEPVQNYSNEIEHILTLEAGDRFIEGRASPDDIKQGEAGDCWFLSSLCSFANYTNKVLKGGKGTDANQKLVDLVGDEKETYALFERVIQETSNQLTKKNSAFMFQFYTLGEWRKVLVDGKLPLRTHMQRHGAGGRRRRGRTFVKEEINDFWALLLEKAFAKLVGGYMKLEGGVPGCALTHLSGGITTSDVITSDSGNRRVVRAMIELNIFDYLESIEDAALIVASNTHNSMYEGAMGLVAGHAYAVEDFEEVATTAAFKSMHPTMAAEYVKIVKLRNPHGEGEWTGDWSDKWLSENRNELLVTEGFQAIKRNV